MDVWFRLQSAREDPKFKLVIIFLFYMMYFINSVKYLKNINLLGTLTYLWIIKTPLQGLL